jgi:hypothetical protein
MIRMQRIRTVTIRIAIDVETAGVCVNVGVVRVGLLIIAALAGSGAVAMLAKHQAGFATSLIALTGWTLVLACRPELVPFVGRTAVALVRTRLIFGGLAVIFLALTVFGGFLELPRLLGPRYAGVVVGFDAAAPAERRSACPLVEFTDASGQRQVVSAWSATARPPRPGARLMTFRLNDVVSVTHYSGAYHPVTRNEYSVLGAVVGLPGAAFVLCAGLALMAHLRLAAFAG